MNKQQLIEMLNEINNNDSFDAEDKHLHADSLLLDYINDEEISETFNKIEKWYA